MNEISKTLYIPLCGKAQVSKKGIILKDAKAEEIWEKEQFPLKGKAKSKWLGYFMSMRARVFDDWTASRIELDKDAVVLHIGCGMDSRALRIGKSAKSWYDIDFPAVIDERRKYYSEGGNYRMIGANAAETEWLDSIPENGHAIVIMEGISMYITNRGNARLFDALQSKFAQLDILVDVYTELGARVSKYKNPINEVGVTTVYGIADPQTLLNGRGIVFVGEHTMTPPHLVNELKGFDYRFFRLMFTGKATRKVYRLFEYEKPC